MAYYLRGKRSPKPSPIQAQTGHAETMNGNYTYHVTEFFSSIIDEPVGTVELAITSSVFGGPMDSKILKVSKLVF